MNNPAIPFRMKLTSVLVESASYLSFVTGDRDSQAGRVRRGKQSATGFSSFAWICATRLRIRVIYPSRNGILKACMKLSEPLHLGRSGGDLGDLGQPRNSLFHWFIRTRLRAVGARTRNLQPVSASLTGRSLIVQWVDRVAVRSDSPTPQPLSAPRFGSTHQSPTQHPGILRNENHSATDRICHEFSKLVTHRSKVVADRFTTTLGGEPNDLLIT